MQSCDVIVVGGGPAGSSCAWKLQQAGLDVVVLDKKPFPRDKTCAGWVTPPVIQALQLDLDDYRRQHVLQPITGFRSGVIGGPEVQTRYDQPVSYGIRRCQFDHYLLQRSGARCQLGQPVSSLQRQGSHWVINQQLTAPLLVGAGGHFCPVARLLGARQQAAAVVAAQEVEFVATDEQLACIEPETPELFFCRDLQGYGWCFRKDNYLNIGLGRVDAQGISSQVAEFVDFLRARKKLRGSIPDRFHGHAYQLYERVLPKLIDDGVLLIGDAAGLAYPQSGEGIRPAVESGLIAAEVIRAARDPSQAQDPTQEQYARPALQPYQDRLLARFGPPRSTSPAAWLPAACLPFLAARLLANRWFSRHILLERWFLHTRESPLRSG